MVEYEEPLEHFVVPSDHERHKYVQEKDWASAAYVGGYRSAIEHGSVADMPEPHWVFDDTNFNEYYWRGAHDAIGDRNNGRI